MFADPPEVSVDESGANLNEPQVSTTKLNAKISSLVPGNAWYLLF